MKSEYYKQIQNDTYPKKQDQKYLPKRKIHDSIIHNAQTHSRHFKSEKRDIKNSIDMMKKSKQETQFSKMKLSYSKPMPQNNVQFDKFGVQWADLKCMDCQNLRQQQNKQIKQFQMLYQQELTQQKEQYILMQKKYLLKENQFIKLFNEHDKLQRNYMEIHNQNIELKAHNQIITNHQKRIEQELEKIILENKNNIQKVDSLHRFLKLYLQQTKVVINWANLFQSIRQDIPILIQAIREDILVRKFDFQVTLKEAATFQRINFGNITLSKEEPSPFMDEDSACENFMKYLKQSEIHSKSKIHAIHTSTKKGHNSFIDSFSNKENVDFLNGVSIKSMLNSRIYDSKQKQKVDPMSDQCLRLLLLQAKAIEASRQFKTDSMKNSASRMIIDDSQQQKQIEI